MYTVARRELSKNVSAGAVAPSDPEIQWRIQGGDCATTPFGLTAIFLDIFCSVFVSFVSRMNREVRVPRFLSVKNCVKKCIQSYHIGDFFPGEGCSSLHHTTPLAPSLLKS